MTPRRISLLFGAIIIAAITVLATQVPFLWDTAYHSQVANEFFSGGFHNYIPSQGTDNGNPVLYPVLLAITWFIGGHTLLASHLFFALVLVFLLAGLIRLGSMFIHGSWLIFLPFLLWADPSILAQSMLMGYDLLMLGLTLWALVAVIEARPTMLFFLLAALSLIHFRGIPAIAFVLLAQLLIGSGKWRQYWPYVLTFLVWCAWHLWHYIATGWILIPEVDSLNADISVVRLMRNGGYIFWRSQDLGRIGLWLVLALLMWRSRKGINKLDKQILILSIAPLIIHWVAFGLLKMPVSQRYFITSQVLAMILMVRLLRFETFYFRTISFAVVMGVLLTGHLWFYPSRFGNAWDSTLHFFSWLKVDKEMNDYLREHDIPVQDVGAKYPLTYSRNACYLEPENRGFSDLSISNGLLPTFVLYSNFSNMYTSEEREQFNRSLVRCWESKNGRVEAILYSH